MFDTIINMDIKPHPEKPGKAVVTADTPEELFVVAGTLTTSAPRFFGWYLSEFRVARWRTSTAEYPREVTLTHRELGRIAAGQGEISYIVETEDDARLVVETAASFAEQAYFFIYETS